MAEEEQLSPIELEHIIGLSGCTQSKLLAVNPVKQDEIIHSVGQKVVISQLTDAHDQTLLSLHTANVSVIRMSESGALFATGQVADDYGQCCVIVWETATREMLFRIECHPEGVHDLQFSPDEEMLATSGVSDNTIAVWSLATGRFVDSQTSGPTFIAWAPVSRRRRPTYHLASAQGKTLLTHQLEYDRGSLAYRMSTEVVSMPSTGLVRSYTCGVVDPSGTFLLAGTGSGDVAIANLRELVFRAYENVGGAVNAIFAVGDPAVIYTVGVDGAVCRLAGSDQRWAVERLADGPKAFSAAIRADDLLVASADGSLASVSIHDGHRTVLANHSTSAVTAVCCGTASDTVYTLTAAGDVMVWSLVEYTLLHREHVTDAPGTAIAIHGGSLYTGWGDGSLIVLGVHDGHLTRAQHVPNIHKGGVTAISVNDLMVATGGGDGIARLWSLQTVQFASQHAFHTSPITGLVCDTLVPHILHAAASSGICTIDVRSGKRIKQFPTVAQPTTTLIQLAHGDKLLVSGTATGQVRSQDFDIPAPIAVLETGHHVARVAADSADMVVAVATNGPELLFLDARRLAQGVDAMIPGDYGAHVRRCTDLTWTGDGRQVVSVGEDGEVCVWNYFPEE